MALPTGAAVGLSPAAGGWLGSDGSWGEKGFFRESGTNWKWGLGSAGSRAAPKPSMHLQHAVFVLMSSSLLGQDRGVLLLPPDPAT